MLEGQFGQARPSFVLSKRTDAAALSSVSHTAAALSSTIAVLQKIHTKVAAVEADAAELAATVLRKVATVEDPNVLAVRVVGDAGSVMEALGKITTIMSLASNAKRLAIAQVMDPAEALAGQVYAIRQAAADRYLDNAGTNSGSPSSPSSRQRHHDAGLSSGDLEIRSLMRQHKYALDEGQLLLSRIAAVRQQLGEVEEKLLAHFGVVAAPYCSGEVKHSAAAGHAALPTGSPTTVRRREGVSIEQIAQEVAAEMRKDPRYWGNSPSPRQQGEHGGNTDSSSPPLGFSPQRIARSLSQQHYQEQLAKLEALITGEVALQQKIISVGGSVIDVEKERRKIQKLLLGEEDGIGNSGNIHQGTEENFPSSCAQKPPHDDDATTIETEEANQQSLEQIEAYERLRARIEADEQAKLEAEAEAEALAELEREAEDEANTAVVAEQSSLRHPQQEPLLEDLVSIKDKQLADAAAAVEALQRVRDEMQSQFERFQIAADMERMRAETVAEELERARSEAASEQQRLLTEVLSRDRLIAEQEEALSQTAKRLQLLEEEGKALHRISDDVQQQSKNEELAEEDMVDVPSRQAVEAVDIQPPSPAAENASAPSAPENIVDSPAAQYIGDDHHGSALEENPRDEELEAAAVDEVQRSRRIVERPMEDYVEMSDDENGLEGVELPQGQEARLDAAADAPGESTPCSETLDERQDTVPTDARSDRILDEDI